MPLSPTYASFELADGTIVEDVRITYGDRIAYEKTAKMRGWQAAEKPITTAGYLAWHAAKRLEKIKHTYEAFVADLVDCSMDDHAADAEHQADDDDPTRQDHSTAL